MTRHQKRWHHCWRHLILGICAVAHACCGRQGASGMHPRGFHDLNFILMVKRILLLALISSRTAAVGIRSGSHVVGRSGEKGHPAAAGRSVSSVCVSLSPWIHRSRSQAAGLLPWIGGGGQVILISLGVNSPVLGDHLPSWDRKPEGSNSAQSLGIPSVLEDAWGPGCVWLGVLLGAKAPRDDVTMWWNRVDIVPILPKCPVPVSMLYRCRYRLRYIRG